MNSNLSHNKTLDVAGAAELLGIRSSTVRKYVLEKRLPYFKIGARVTFDTDDLLKWREQFRVKAIA